MEYKLLNSASSFSDKNGIIELAAPDKTDFFIDICTDYKKLNAPFYHTAIESDFILRCSVTPDFGSTYDAGCLLVYDADDKWIKFAFENTDLGHAAVVAVVTNGYSDDSNGEVINNRNIRMQIVRKDNNWCLHYSNDKTTWNMVRYFRLALNKQVKIGISSQSPAGEGCRVVFEDLEILSNHYRDIRKPR